MRAMVAFALLDFPGAMQRADDVLRQSPDDLAALGVAGDARLETGDIARCSRAIPSAGRAGALTGGLEPAGPAGLPGRSRSRHATRLPRRCFIASGGAPDAEAFYDFQLGDLHRATGNLVGAEAAYTASLAALPEYVPAMNGLAAVLAATDRRDEAIQLLERATASAATARACGGAGRPVRTQWPGRAGRRRVPTRRRYRQLAAATGSATTASW